MSPPIDPSSKEKYAQVLSLAWQFYEAQRSGPIPPGYPVPWVTSSLLTDAVVGGWYDAGDTLKLNFPLGATVSFLAWGLVEFRDAYAASGSLDRARADLRVAVDYLTACHTSPRQYIGQISEPQVDHSFWGRPSQYPLNIFPRQTFIWDDSTRQADLLGAVAAALASASMVYKDVDPAYADGLLAKAKDLWQWGTQSEGLYSDYHVQATTAYPSDDWEDHMVWGAAWLYRCTGDASYLTAAQKYWTMRSSRSGQNPYASWGSLWAPAASMLLGMADDGVAVPGVETYRAFFNNVFLRSWLTPDGQWDIIQTPLGMIYPEWSKWGNLALSTTASMTALMHAKRNRDLNQRAAEIAFARGQLEYVLGSAGRSFVVGWGSNPPTQPHHAGASCPDMPAPCGWAQFSAPGPNPQVVYGGLVGGPGGVLMDKSNPDAFYDLRTDPLTTEVSLYYNAGFASSLAGLYQML